MENIEKLRNDLRNTIPLGIDLTLQALKQNIPAGSAKYDDLILLESRYRELNQQLLRGVIDNDDAQIEFNKLREALLQFIIILEASDLQDAPPQAAGDAKRGKILHRIPDQMQLAQEVKCIIRVAFDENILREDLDHSADDVVKDIRIAEVMAVALIDPAENPAFSIRTFSEEVQFIDEGAFTEWLFYVKPLLEGTFPLLLKVSVIEMVNGRERKREIVLEETIQVVATNVKIDEAAPMKESGAAVVMGGQPLPGTGPVAPQPSGNVPRSAPPPKSGRRMMQRISAIAAVLAGFGLIWALTLRNNFETQDPGKVWREIEGTEDTAQLKEFLDQFPEDEHAPVAAQALEELRFYVDVLQSEDSLIFLAYGGNYPMEWSMYKDGELLFSQIMMTDYTALDLKSTGLSPGEYEAVWKDADGMERRQKITILPPPSPEPTSTPGSTGTNTTQPAAPTVAPTPAKPKPRPRPRPTPPATNQTPTNQTPTTSTAVEPVKPEPPSEPLYTFKSVARYPLFKGCKESSPEKVEKCFDQKMQQFLSRNLKYPEAAVKNKVEGTVMVTFIIGKDGKVQGEKVEGDPGSGCGEEARRLVEALPAFKPALNALGDPVRVLFRLPVRFQLNN